MLEKQILFKNISYLVSFNDKDEIFQKVDILVSGPKIIAIGKNLYASDEGEIVDCSGLVAMPGFVNCHHHLYQSLFRGIREVQEMPLFPWLEGLYEFWKHIDIDAVHYGALVGFSELLRTGCTTTMDHHYVFPKTSSNKLIDEEILAAKQIGIRFHATRGSMSLGRKSGGLPPETVVQTNTEILEDSERLINLYHDSSIYSMQRIALAPCSPFSVTKELMWETKELARKKGVMLHTHLAETLDEEKFCIEKYGKRPFELMEDLEWVGNDVWYAHAIYLNDREINALNGTGIAHCPSSNMKLGSGICKSSDLVKAGVHLGIGVDGSASNDGSNMWEEIRRTYLLNHLRYGSQGLSAYQVLRIATRGGAEVLGRDDIGILEVNKAADLVFFDLNDIAYAGCHDPLYAIVNCGNTSLVKMTIVNGKIVVKNGEILTIDKEKIYIEAQKLSNEIVKKQRNPNL